LAKRSATSRARDRLSAIEVSEVSVSASRSRVVAMASPCASLMVARARARAAADQAAGSSEGFSTLAPVLIWRAALV